MGPAQQKIRASALPNSGDIFLSKHCMIIWHVYMYKKNVESPQDGNSVRIPATVPVNKLYHTNSSTVAEKVHEYYFIDPHENPHDMIRQCRKGNTECKGNNEY